MMRLIINLTRQFVKFFCVIVENSVDNHALRGYYIFTLRRWAGETERKKEMNKIDNITDPVEFLVACRLAGSDYRVEDFSVAEGHTGPCKIIVEHHYYGGYSPIYYATDCRGVDIIFADVESAKKWIDDAAAGAYLQQNEFSPPSYTIVMPDPQGPGT